MQGYAKCMVYILLFVDNNKTKKQKKKKKQKKNNKRKQQQQLQTQNAQVNYYELDLRTYFNTFALISLPRKLRLMLRITSC